MTGPQQIIVAALAGTLLAVGSIAQDSSWHLPVRGFADYQRTTTTWQVAPAQASRGGGLLRPIDSSSAWRVRSWPAAPIADGFQVLDFDDTAWRDGLLPLETGPTGSAWPEAERVLDGRVQFEVPSRTKGAVLTVEHDDDVTIWLNGVQILTRATDGRQERTELVFTDDLLGLFERRRNVLSIQVRNKADRSRVGVELVVSPRPFAAPENALARVDRDRQQAAQVRDGMFTVWRGPAVLCDGELDPDRRFVTTPPVDFRDLGAYVAFDLRAVDGRGGPMAAFVPVSWKLGDLKLSGRAEARDADGRQRIVLAVEGVKPDARRYEKRFFEHETMRWWDFTFAGELVVDRWFDAARGVVTKFESRLLGRLSRARGEDEVRDFELEFAETWTLKGVREARDGKFQDDVANAIRTGADFLRRFANDPDTEQLKAGGEDRTYPSGRLGLLLLAMIHADVPRDDEVLVRGLDSLRARKLVDTYSTAHAIMAIEAYYAPRGEYEDLRAGLIDKPRARQIPERDLKLVREWTAILLDNMDTRVDPAYLARWSYVKEPRYDHSVNQYGLLGLYSAHLCGVEISPQIWRAAAAHLVDSQQKPAKRLPLELTSHQQLESMRGGSTTTTGTRATSPAGWSYVEAESNGEERPIYGSMTCAGLTGLAIALAGMRDSGMNRDKTVGEATESVRMGFAWLAQNFTVRWHPGPGLVASYYTHHYYYLYGLERACELSGVALLNGRDWYQEGALALLAEQNTDGSWSGMSGGDYDASTYTAMAILFLKKASMPVYTNR